MKKQLLLVSAVFVAIAANAQITITSADIAPINMNVRQVNDTAPVISVGSAGASQTWNLSGLNTHTTDTIYFMPPNWMPGASNFPTANYGIKMMQMGQNANVFADKNTSSLSIKGITAAVDIMGTPYNVVLRNTPSEIVTNFPSTYNSTFTNNFVTKGTFYFGIDPGIGFTVDSVRLVSHVAKTVAYDGWGSVTTPMGTYNSLRVKTLKHTTDTISGYIAFFDMWVDFQTTEDSSKTYTWWANALGFSLAEVTVDVATDAPIRATWMPAAPVVGINEYVNAEQVNVYPNPAQNTLFFSVDASKAKSIQVFDIAGKMMNAYSINVNNPQIDVSTFANGIYSYTIVDKNGEVLNRGKFTVAK